MIYSKEKQEKNSKQRIDSDRLTNKNIQFTILKTKLSKVFVI